MVLSSRHVDALAILHELALVPLARAPLMPRLSLVSLALKVAAASEALEVWEVLQVPSNAIIAMDRIITLGTTLCVFNLLGVTHASGLFKGLHSSPRNQRRKYKYQNLLQVPTTRPCTF